LKLPRFGGHLKLLEEVFMGRSFQKRHSAAFKVEAVRTMHARLATGLTLQRISEELDIGPDQLRGWAKQVAGAPPDANPEDIFPGGGKRRRFTMAESVPPPANESPEAELRRLRRENERLRQERDFLKKAAAFFAKESP
jgi:transposase